MNVFLLFVFILFIMSKASADKAIRHYVSGEKLSHALEARSQSTLHSEAIESLIVSSRRIVCNAEARDDESPIEIYRASAFFARCDDDDDDEEEV